MKRIEFFIACMLFGVTLTFAQGKAEISVSETSHNFGTIYEEDGDASCEFIVTNTGNAPLELNRVTASCGCTTPNWTKEPIAPGKTGVVKATYAAKGRPGPFSKTISIYSNAQDAPFIVTIKGTVASKASETANVQLTQAPVSIEPAKTPVSTGNTGTTYVVKKGDTLEKISKNAYGTTNKVKEIKEKNNIKNNGSLKVGQTIVLP